ncbi:major facilitator superfamily domain-containing protein [Microdochium trichocladiopsis]|uniref:Major facilitator superfamily domain-containing protein n=1 Tax=Microdochium trichocladiopsis TaxID=1682393 RepID=A0A9P8Y021_9PEZI|nr:major facilitator superfamily domain-containing protein [Microdochium trichocladiopsis]KAH7024778.1 major facilitator superfamily domain-containing protein [Microdochium trichocladiopsis]
MSSESTKSSATSPPTPKAKAGGAIELSRQASATAGTSTEYHQISTFHRYYGLAALCFLNMVQVWGWLSYATVNIYAQEWFGVDAQAINWFSTAYGLAVIPFPFAAWFINRYGTRKSVLVGAAGTILGNWIRYAGTAKASMAGAIIGQLILALSQIFVLPVAPVYSSQWFRPDRRTTPTTFGTISPTIGSMLGSFTTPFLAQDASQLPQSILIVAGISTAAAASCFFFPEPPREHPASSTPESLETSDTPSPWSYALRMLKSPEFYMLAVPFIVGLLLFNAFATLLLLYLAPYGFPLEDAGLLTGLQTGVGCAVALVVAPLVDRWRLHIPAIQSMLVLGAGLYIAFIFVPASESRVVAFVVCTLMGVFGTTVLSLILETLAEILYPVPPEFISTVCWCMGNVLGAVTVFGFAAGINPDGNPPGEASRALYAQAGVAVVLVGAPPLLLGLFGRKDKIKFRRREAQTNAIPQANQTSL